MNDTARRAARGETPPKVVGANPPVGGVKAPGHIGFDLRRRAGCRGVVGRDGAGRGSMPDVVSLEP